MGRKHRILAENQKSGSPKIKAVKHLGQQTDHTKIEESFHVTPENFKELKENTRTGNLKGCVWCYARHWGTGSQDH